MTEIERIARGLTLHVLPWTFSEMHKAALKAEIEGSDAGLAAWEVTGLPISDAPLFQEVTVVVNPTLHVRAHLQETQR